MNPISEQQKKSVQNVRFTPTEREAMRNTLIQEMTAHPITNVASVRSGQVNRHQWSREQLTTVRSRKHMTIAILIAIFMSGSVSYAAEGAIPGDILYPVKIHVNENVESAFAVSSESEAELEAEFAERRLVEAEVLRAESRLDEKTKAELRAQFNAHTRDMEVDLRELADDDSERAEEISSDFEATLTEHVDTLKIFGHMIDARASGKVETSGAGSVAPKATSQGAHRSGELLDAVFLHNDDNRVESTENDGREIKVESSASPSSYRADNALIDGTEDTHVDTDARIQIGEEKSRIELETNLKTDGGLKVGL